MKYFFSPFLLISVLLILTSCDIDNKQGPPTELSEMNIEKGQDIKETTDDLVAKSENIDHLNTNDVKTEEKVEQAENHNNLYDKYMENLQYLDGIEAKMLEAVTTVDMVETRENALYHWDIELNKIYALLIEKLSTDDIEELRTEQRKWIKDRDEAANNVLSFGGSAANIDYADILFSLTKKRTVELVHMYFSYGSDKSYDVDELFAPIINAYIELEQSSFKSFDDEIIGDSLLATDNGDTYNFDRDGFPTLKYAFYDINADGTMELLIGANDSIAGIYALQNGKPAYIIQAEIKYGIYLFEDIDGNIVIECSWGHMGYAMELFYTIDTNGNLVILDTLYTNGDEIINSEFIGHFRAREVDGKEVNITEEEYCALIRQYGSWGYEMLKETGKVRNVDIGWMPIAVYDEISNDM